MPRYALEIAYDGTRYSGWQKQPDAETVQGATEQALSLLLQEQVQLYGSGRTDTGVHARQQIAHFDTFIPVETSRICQRLARVLPDDIHVRQIKPVPEYFHARFDAAWRQYRYQLALHADPFERLYSWHVGRPVAWDEVSRCLERLEGEHDFSGFAKKSSELPHGRCTVLQAGLHRQGNLLVVTIRANRFLRSMMRALIGAAIQTATGQKERGWFDERLAAPALSAGLVLAPAHGLALEKVFYPQTTFDLT